jgi:hypothetical protein
MSNEQANFSLLITHYYLLICLPKLALRVGHFFFEVAY